MQLAPNTPRKTWHSYHLVDPSPWPILTGISVFSIVFGMVLYMHGFSLGYELWSEGLLLTCVGAFFWWRDVIREATFEGAHTSIVRRGLRFGMVLFIVSEIMLFFAFFWAFLHSSLNPVPQIGGVWPPRGIQPIDPWAIPLYNTFLLLTSGAALTWAHHSLVGGYRLEVITGLEITLLLALLFTACQLYEYINAPFHLSDGVYGSTFYMLTGLHGFHVIVGTLFLTVCFFRVLFRHFVNTVHVGFESAAWYWHFVDVVWLLLFALIYVWGGGSPEEYLYRETIIKHPYDDGKHYAVN
jgi:cytochrome c oxidase subunit 3